MLFSNIYTLENTLELTQTKEMHMKVILNLMTVLNFASAGIKLVRPKFPKQNSRFFAEIVRKVFARDAYQSSVIRPGHRMPLTSSRSATAWAE
jgi:hypothetical protein